MVVVITVTVAIAVTVAIMVTFAVIVNVVCHDVVFNAGKILSLIHI